jgi:DNA-directed RNA polymerase subunit M/transcription elongation factor TFIIS
MPNNINNPELFRTNIRSKIHDIIRDECKENILDGEIISGNIEKSIFNYAIKESTIKNIVKKWSNEYFVHLYKDKLRSVYFNIKSDTIFMKSIIKGDIDPKLVAFMTHQDINPARWNEIIKRKTIRDESKLSNGVKANTSLYTCKKCKSKNCTFYEAQTRSADEASTIFVTCLNCGKNFKY